MLRSRCLFTLLSPVLIIILNDEVANSYLTLGNIQLNESHTQDNVSYQLKRR